MRVLINTIPLYGKSPGIRTYTANLLRALHASDVDMEWHVLLHPADRERLDLDGDSRFRLVGFSHLTGFATVAGLRFIWRNAVEHLALGTTGAACDVIHYLDGYGPLFTVRSVPVALTVHDLLPLRRERYFARWAQEYLAMLMRSTIPRAQAILAISAATARELTAVLGIPPDRITTAPNGIDSRFRPYAMAERRQIIARYNLPARYVIYVGAINPRKNVARLIRAFATAQQTLAMPHALLLAGPLGWQYADVLRAMHEANVAAGGEIVRHLGYVADDEIGPLMAGAECLAYPSLAEGFGLPVIEAMACGTAVLTSSALAETAKEAALLVDPTDEKSIMRGLLSLFVDADVRDRLIEAGHAVAREHTWARVAQACVELYAQLGAGSRSEAECASLRM